IQDRRIYIPKGAIKIENEQAQSVVYTHEASLGRFSAMGFAGKALKPTFHYRFSSADRRAQYIAQFFEGQARRIQRRKDSNEARKAFQHAVKVGDVFYTSWGYDQTNVEYFQVVGLRGAKQVLVRAIGKHYEETGFMSGKSAPKPGDFLANSCALGSGNPAKVCTVRAGYRN